MSQIPSGCCWFSLRGVCFASPFTKMMVNDEPNWLLYFDQKDIVAWKHFLIAGFSGWRHHGITWEHVGWVCEDSPRLWPDIEISTQRPAWIWINNKKHMKLTYMNINLNRQPWYRIWIFRFIGYWDVFMWTIHKFHINLMVFFYIFLCESCAFSPLSTTGPWT